ncbi:MAG: ABC transporter substrate-binding protein [Leucobacter sp.]
MRIGFINVQGGVASYPEVTGAVEAAAELVNEHLGGVQGHPLEIETCFIVEGDEDALKCAQQFVNDPSIVAIQLGMTIFGTGPIYQAVGDRKPILGFGPFNPQDLTAENVVYYTASTYAIVGGTILHAADLGVERLAVIYDDNPGTQGQVALMSAVAPEFDIEISAIPVSNPSEWSSAMLAAGAQTADAVAIAALPTSCVPAAQAAQQLGVTAPVFTTDLCLTPSLEEELGEWPEWIFVGPTPKVYGDADKQDVAEFIAAMDHFAAGESQGGAGPASFGLVLSMVHHLNEIGVDEVTPEGLFNALHGFTGPAYIGPPALSCGQFSDKEAPSLCAAYSFLSSYEDGEWSAVQIDTKGLGLGAG